MVLEQPSSIWDIRRLSFKLAFDDLSRPLEPLFELVGCCAPGRQQDKRFGRLFPGAPQTKKVSVLVGRLNIVLSRREMILKHQR